MNWEFEALTLDEAYARKVIQLDKDGKYQQRYYNKPNKKEKRCIIAAKSNINAQLVGIATTFNQKQGEWLVQALEISADKMTIPFPTQK